MGKICGVDNDHDDREVGNDGQRVNYNDDDDGNINHNDDDRKVGNDRQKVNHNVNDDWDRT